MAAFALALAKAAAAAEVDGLLEEAAVLKEKEFTLLCRALFDITNSPHRIAANAASVRASWRNDIFGR